MVALLFQQLFLLEIPFSVPISHAVMFHKRPRVVSHFDFWYVVSSVLPDADAVVRRSLVVAGMGKKSLIKSGDGDAVLSLPPSTKNLHANEIALCESGRRRREDEDGVKLITKAATGIKSLV